MNVDSVRNLKEVMEALNNSIDEGKLDLVEGTLMSYISSRQYSLVCDNGYGTYCGPDYQEVTLHVKVRIYK